jgi:mRNA interferase RelE/StbE
MAYQVLIPKPVQKQLDRLSDKARDRILKVLLALKENPRPHAKEFLMTTYEQLIQEGKQEGLQEATNRFLTQLIAKKFQQDPGELAPLLGNLSVECQEELIERILQSRSIQEVIDWMKSVGAN